MISQACSTSKPITNTHVRADSVGMKQKTEKQKQAWERWGGGQFFVNVPQTVMLLGKEKNIMSQIC